MLKALEVWGIPSRTNTQSNIELINRLWNNEGPSTSAAKRILPNNDVALNTPLSFDIPDEFLDAITHELLVMPFILPSGNIIDETTLMKHNQHEEMYGRLPSDPFTSIIYTPDNQPKFSDALKFRLDEFKLRNQHESDIMKSGRTVGRKPEEPVASTSTCSYTNNGHVSKKIKFNGSSDLDSLISSIYRNNQVSIFTRSKEARTEGNCCNCEAPRTENFYRISQCSHVFCKPCLLQQNSSCSVCETSFQTKDVVKLNL